VYLKHHNKTYGGDKMAAFKDRIKGLRIENDLTLKELSKKIGYSESSICMYESGKRLPKKPEDYIKIADFFDVTLDYLLGKSDDKNSFYIQRNKKTSIYNDFIDLLIKHGKITCKKDLTTGKIFEIFNEIFNKS
jgi:transcriptional regulator with XRE-family HTH domain